jgi:uncharacterized protein (UPF0335 family)
MAGFNMKSVIKILKDTLPDLQYADRIDIVSKYISALERIDEEQSQMDDASKGIFDTDNVLTYIIGNNLAKCLRLAVMKRKYVEIIGYMDMMNSETDRLSNLIAGIEKPYVSKITREDAENLLSRYVNKDQISENILNIYPDKKKVIDATKIFENRTKNRDK